jgi:hypothetical protein
VAFHALRRCRVLLRDIFRLGTATVYSLSGPGVVPGRASSVWVGSKAARTAHRGSASLVVHVRGVLREPHPAVGAQSGAVLGAQRAERQCQHHRIPQEWLEVDQVVLDPSGLVVLGVALGVGVQLLQVDVELEVEVLQAPGAFPDNTCMCRPDTSTPSITDSSRRSRSIGLPSGRPEVRCLGPPAPEPSAPLSVRCPGAG